MNRLDVPTKVLDELTFKMYSTEEIIKMSAIETTNPVPFDKLANPNRNGLYDPRLGPNNEEKCPTCGQSSSWCIGHMSFIRLSLPVFNPLFLRSTFNLLRMTCLKCHNFGVPPRVCLGFAMQMKALRLGLNDVALEMEQVANQVLEANELEDKDQASLNFSNELEDLLTKGLAGARDSNMDQLHTKASVELEIKFTSRFYEYRKGKCCRCKFTNPNLFLEHNNRIVMGRTLITKVKDKKTAKSSSKENKQTGDQLLGDVDPDDKQVDVIAQRYFTPKQAKEHLLKVYANEPHIVDCLYGSLVDKKTTQTVTPIDALFLDVFPVPPTRFRPLMKAGGQSYMNPQSATLNKILVNSILLKHLGSAINGPPAEIPDSMKLTHKGDTAAESVVTDQLQLQYVSTSSPQEPMAGVERPVVFEIFVKEFLLFGIKGATPSEKLHNCWNELQNHVNSVFDSSLDKLSRDKTPGVKQLLEKKDGLFRKNMMGKRVNHAARSVISPDPYIDIDEVGIPEIFAKCLTYPTPVTPWNVKELRQAVINGPDVHPGAIFVKMEDDLLVKLPGHDHRAREAIAKQLLTHRDDGNINKPKIVYRHLRNGDILLMNRQPTLHKPSIMAHKARVLKGERTLRLNYSNCKTYNADFDGDEMNAHFPQSELARSEGYNIASVNQQYLVPKDGTPLGGLIQDHIISAVLLMTRGRFFERSDYNQLVFGAITNKDGPIKLLPPAIMKPHALWSGKQVASTVIINTIPPGEQLFSLTRKTKTPVKCWEKETPRPWLAGGSPLYGIEMSESEVIVRKGELLCGVLDKAHCGPTQYGLIHCCYELYGGEVAMTLLSRFERLFTHFLPSEGFTLGVEDILIVAKADKKRRHLMKRASKMGRDVVCQAFDLSTDVEDYTLKDKYATAHLKTDDKDIRNLDLCMKGKTDQVNNDINKVCMPNGLRKQFPENNLQLMVLSGAKGATVNCMQISCLLGQIELEGRRPPMMISGKTLPSFLPYCTSPRAGGFVDGRFLTGIKPQEYFFHCMAGREGLIDTAVKTSRSGYLQRCLIKHMEGLTVAYDLTVRDSDGTVIQFMYGEDALDILKVPFLKEDQLQFLADNHKALYKESTIDKVCQVSECKHDKLLKEHKKIRKHWRRYQQNALRVRNSGFLQFSQTQMPDLDKVAAVELWHKLDLKEKLSFSKKAGQVCQPVFTTYRPDSNFGAISEKLDKIIEDYLASRPSDVKVDDKSKPNADLPSKSTIRKMFHHKIMTSFCEPGEAVGLLAAQSVGEPSTQMTLNTFHFAGRGEMNVTLGIPRLREILMSASKTLLTPTMEIPFLDCPDLESKSMKLKKRLSRVYLSEVVESIETTESVQQDSNEFCRHYKIRFNFLPRKAYKGDMQLSPDRILKYMESLFLSLMAKLMLRKVQMLAKASFIGDVRKREKMEKPTNIAGEDDANNDRDEERDTGGDGDKDDGSESSGDEMAEDDAVAIKSRDRHAQEREYDDEEAESEDEDKDDDAKSVSAESAKGKVVKEQLPIGEDDGEGDLFVDNQDEMLGETNDLDVTQTSLTEEDPPEDMEQEQENVEDDPDEVPNASKREQALKLRNKYIKSYSYDLKKGRWCEVVIGLNIALPKVDVNRFVREQVERAILKETNGLKVVFVSDQRNADGSSTKILKTDGINIVEMFKHENLLDLRRLHTNNIHEMAAVYGIEAAGRVLVREIKNVFQVYGIEVDPRHLLLIADYMTSDGVYKAFSRQALVNCISPLQQMTFETTINFMKAAAQKGMSDHLKSPSSRLVVGRPVGCGTGCFDLIHDLKV